MEKKLELIATSTFGLEAVVKREVQALGYDNVKVSDGKITYTADKEGIVRSNLWLRTADRVLLKMGEFKATTFTELFEQTKALPWEEWIEEDGKFTVTGRSVKSTLFSTPDCQAIVKKAVVEKLKTRYQTEWFKETGAEYTIKVSLLKDMATLTIDTTGAGLHKRGYRAQAMEAPLKETIASALIQLSYWRNNRILLDPFCGSGTIPIEAALIGKNIAPGLNRRFASEEWACIPQELWKKARIAAFQAIRQEEKLKIHASDIDPQAIELAKENALEAGVDDCIEFSVRPVSQVKPGTEYGVVICNPPYGNRIGEKEELAEIYHTLGRNFRIRRTWSVYVLTAEEQFEALYGQKADRKRKLFNGNIRVDYYQFYGQRPPKAEN
ncbi:MAG: class I SAM-dependent RNA methyltransferase [bacterium]